ncbi:uncharacterized protein [Clytia hemisphaerica]|uniref:uncharacterized protein n=1 Tax=Clytia hemisphaerica TaxID=252671 RepID=UPI0034D69EB7
MAVFQYIYNDDVVTIINKDNNTIDGGNNVDGSENSEICSNSNNVQIENSIDHTVNSDASDVAGHDDNDDDDVDHGDNIIHEIQDDINPNFHLNNTGFDEVDTKRASASFILKIRERNKLTQATVDSVVEGTELLMEQIIASKKLQIEKALEQCPSNCKDEIIKILENTTSPFEGLETRNLQDSYVKANFNHVDYKVVPLGKKLILKKKGHKRMLVEKDENYIYIPLLESLKQFLSNKRIRTLVLRQPTLSESGVYYDIYDGAIYRNDNYFKQHPNALMLILDHDEVEVCNPLGSKRTKHKVDMYYYSVANLNPKFRSKHCSVRLLAIANAQLVKKYGINKIMDPIIDDLCKLHDGINLIYDTEIITVYGKVILCAGDTLGQQYLGGFKEGVGQAFQKCRSCYCHFEEMQTNFEEEEFICRTKAEYEKACDAIESNETTKSRFSLLYGITERSCLTRLPGFDVTRQLPQDIMHTILEGTLQYEVRLVLQHFVNLKMLKLKQLNSAIENHAYGYSEVNTKPGPLKDTVFNGKENYKLKYNAAQARVFLRLLPFYLSGIIDPSDEYFMFMLQLMRIVNFLYAPIIKLETIQLLKHLISDHLHEFCRLFPDVNIIPKQHYTIHLPTMIMDLGPMIRSSCFVFESAHNYFKQLASKQNFKNLELSLASRHQFLETSNFGDGSEDPNTHPLFSTERKLGVLKKVAPKQVKDLRQLFDAQSLLPGVCLETVSNVSWITLHGTRYNIKGLVIVDVSEKAQQPIFGEIKSIWVFKNYVYFETVILKTLYYDYFVNAYKVDEFDCEKTFICNYYRLVDFNVYHKKQLLGNWYVPIKYDLNNIIEEYMKDDLLLRL